MNNNSESPTRKLRIGAVVLAGFITLGALTACSITVPDNGGMGGNGMMNGNDSDTDYAVTEEFGSVDIMFAQMMIPHHEQAIEMSTLAETRTTNPELLALAAGIKAAQAPEIEQMKAWLAVSGGSDMDHEMGDMGMLDEAEMTALAAAKGAAFDTLYLEGMISHHLGAIDMAQMILSSANPEVKKLGENVVSTQRTEIDQMREMLRQ